MSNSTSKYLQLAALLNDAYYNPVLVTNKESVIPPAKGRPRKYNTRQYALSDELYDKRPDGWRRKYPKFSTKKNK